MRLCYKASKHFTVLKSSPVEWLPKCLHFQTSSVLPIWCFTNCFRFSLERKETSTLHKCDAEPIRYLHYTFPKAVPWLADYNSFLEKPLRCSCKLWASDKCCTCNSWIGLDKRLGFKKGLIFNFFLAAERAILMISIRFLGGPALQRKTQ